MKKARRRFERTLKLKVHVHGLVAVGVVTYLEKNVKIIIGGIKIMISLRKSDVFRGLILILALTGNKDRYTVVM